jgi:hypothetical protein
MELYHRASSNEALEVSARAIAIDDEGLIGLFGKFGHNLAIYMPLIDDLRDASPVNGVPKDMLRRKKTVPLVYFHNSLDGDQSLAAGGIMPAPFGAESGQVPNPAFRASGAGMVRCPGGGSVPEPGTDIPGQAFDPSEHMIVAAAGNGWQHRWMRRRSLCG